MSFIATVAPALAEGEVRTMYERQQGRWGYVPDYARAFSARPELMPLWADLLSGIRRHIEPRRFELVTLAAALALGNTACSLAHGRALCKYLPADTVLAIANGVRARISHGTTVSNPGSDPDLSEQDAAIVHFAVRAARSANTIAASDIEALRAVGLSDPEIFDIAATVAARAFFAGLLDTLGVAADAPLGEIEPALREALTVGRPISSAAVERV